MTILDDGIEIERAEVVGAATTLAEPNTIQRLARFGLWQLLAMGATKASALLVSIVVARKLGPDAFGRYSYYSYLLNILPTLFALGIPGAVAKLVAERLGGGNEAAARSLYRLGLRAHLVLLPVPLAVCAVVVHHGSQNLLITASMALGVGIGVLALDFEGLLTATRQFHVLGLVAVLGASLQLVMALACALAHASWPVYVAVQSATVVAGVAVYLVCARGHVFGASPVATRVDRATFVRFAGVMTFSAILNEIIFGRPELLFLARYQAKSALGLYAVALRAATLAAILPQAVGAALLPEFARLRGAGDHDEMNVVFARVCRLLISVAAPLALGGAAVAGPLTLALYGAKYAGAATATAILLGGGLMAAVSGVTTAVVLTGPRPRLIVELGTVVAVVNIAAAFAIIPHFGVTGAAAVNIVVQVASVVTGLVYASVRLGLRFPMAAVARIVAAAVIAAAVASVITHTIGGATGLVAGVITAAATYALVALSTRAITFDELRALRRPRITA